MRTGGGGLNFGSPCGQTIGQSLTCIDNVH